MLPSYLRRLDGTAGASADRPVDWSQLLAAAPPAGLEPALGYALARGVMREAPPAIATRLAHSLAEATARHLVLGRALAGIVDAFGAARIPLLPLKGPVLAEQLYPHPAVRPSSDLDVLVPPSRRHDADAALRTLGYRPTTVDEHDWRFDLAHDGALAYDGPCTVRADLHWRLLTDPRFAWNEPASRAVWSRARPTPFGGVETLALAPDDLLLYLAGHLAVHHGFGGLRWHWDIARVLDGAAGPFDWGTVVDRAAEWELRRALYVALSEVGGTFDIPLPPDVMSRLRPAGMRARTLAAILRRAGEERRQALAHVIAPLVVDRPRALLTALHTALFPRDTWLAARYPSHTSRPGRYLAHARRVGVVALGLAAAIVRRDARTR